MTAPAPARPITAEEFLHMPESDGAELLDGVIVEKNMGNESTWLETEIARLMGNFIVANRLGRVFGAENGLRIWPDRPRHVRKPDVTFVRRGRLPGDRPVRGWQEVVPDLVVEVISPNDTFEDLDLKVLDYLAAGVPVIWIITPATRRAQVITPTSRFDVHPDGTLDGGDILPGFTLSLEELFRALDEG